MSQEPIAPVVPKPALQVVLGKDVQPALDAISNHAAKGLLIRAIQTALLPVCPGRRVEVGYDFSNGSSVRSALEVDADIAAAVPVIRDVLFDAHRYEWDGAELATPAQAVTYVLDRCQTDADLGYLIGPGAQAFRLLCEAEAGALKQPLAAVMDRRSKSLAREPRQYFRDGERRRPATPDDDEGAG